MYRVNKRVKFFFGLFLFWFQTDMIWVMWGQKNMKNILKNVRVYDAIIIFIVQI